MKNALAKLKTYEKIIENISIKLNNQKEKIEKFIDESKLGIYGFYYITKELKFNLQVTEENYNELLELEKCIRLIQDLYPDNKEIENKTEELLKRIDKIKYN